MDIKSLLLGYYWVSIKITHEKFTQVGSQQVDGKVSKRKYAHLTHPGLANLYLKKKKGQSKSIQLEPILTYELSDLNQNYNQRNVN